MNTVSESIFQELDFFAVSLILGVVLVLIYDCLRIFRQIVRHGNFWISVEDFCFWILAGFVIFAMLYQKNDGLIRGFSIGGVALGMLCYNQLVSRYVVKYIVRFLKKLISIVRKICRFVSAPFQKAGTLMMNRQRKITKYLNKRLKKIKKEVKMGISKK